MTSRAGLIFLIDEENGKMVQMYLGKEKKIPVMTIGGLMQKHGEILDDTLDMFEIPYKKVRLADKSTHAQKEGGLYVAVGMGVVMKIRDKSIALIGDSIGYSLAPNREHLERLKEYTDYKIEIF